MADAPVVNDNIASLLEAVTDAVTAVDPRWPAAVHAGRRSVPWAQFEDRAARLAGFLAGEGSAPATGSGSACTTLPSTWRACSRCSSCGPSRST